MPRKPTSRTPQPPRPGFSLVEILIAVSLVAVVAGVGVVAISGSREATREARLQNDVAVLNNGIDAYIASGGVITPGATATQVLTKLKTVASPDSTAMGFAGPFIDPRLQLVMQTTEEAAGDEARADYPNPAGYFYVRKGGGPGIREFKVGEASPVVAEFRQGTMPYTPDGQTVADYTDRPATVPLTALPPALTSGVDEAAREGKDLAKLPRPEVQTRREGSTNPWVLYTGQPLKVSLEGGDAQYPAAVRLFSRFWTADTYFQYSINDGPRITATNNPTPVAASINPDDVVTVWLLSGNTNRYVDSDPYRVVFDGLPVDAPFTGGPDGAVCPPALITYAEAGGAMVDGSHVTPAPIRVELENIAFVPPEYRTSQYVQAYATVTKTERYTETASITTNTSFSAPTFAPFEVSITTNGFGTATSIRVQAEAETYEPKIVTVGPPIDCEVSISPTALSVDILPLKPIGLPPTVTISHSGNVPVGMRKVYTLTTGSAGPNPLDPESGGVKTSAALDYTGSITNYPIATYTVVGQATGPLGAEHWFASQPVRRTYIAITRVPLNYIGLNMRIANINGYVKGSIYMQAGDFAVLNAGANIDGNVYVPGLPSVTLPGGVTRGNNTVVGNGASYVQTNDARIQADRITGQEYTTEGLLADPQSDLRKIVDLYGSSSSTPPTYEVKINNTARIDGKLYRRADPPPVATEKPALPAEIGLSNAPVTVSGTLSLDSGSYAVTMNDTNAVLQLGSPGNLTKYVFGPGSIWSAGRVEVLGPVQIFLNSATSFGGVTFGSSNSIYDTGFVVMSNYTVAIDGGSSVYGQFEARDSEIQVGSGGGSTIRGSLFGSAFANKISVDGSGYVDVSGGSDTNSVTPGPSPTPTPLPSPSPTPTPRPTPTPTPTP